jgi:HEAT repeat protein
VVPFLTWAAVGLAAAGAVSVLVLALRRIVVGRRELRRLGAENRLRPLALALLDDEQIDVGSLDEREARVLADLLARLGRSLRGVSTERIGAFFEDQGWIDRELAVLRGRRGWRRATAAFALGDMAGREAIPALVEALDDPDRDVRAAAARSLGRLAADEAVEPLVYALAEGRVPLSVVGQALLSIGPAALPGLRRLEDAPEAEARAFAIELVGLLGDASDDARVVGRLRDSSAEVRAKAARALRRLGAEEATNELRGALRDRIPFVRAQAAHALGAVGDTSAAPELIEVARTDAFEPAQAAALAASRLDPRAVAAAAARERPGPHLLEADDLLKARR